MKVLRSATSFLLISILSCGISATASVAGVAAAIGWPLSPQNVVSTLSEGGQFGLVGGMLLSLVLLMVRKSNRPSCAGVGIALIAAYAFVAQLYVTAGSASV